MWAVTSYYNPARFKSRLPNYRIFRSRLSVPLVTVELSFDGRFELTKEDADILIQISGGAVLWQKERLLNLAIRSVPSHVNNIAWIDCDVIFEKKGWVEQAKAQLETFNVVQLLSDQVDLSPNDLGSNVDLAYIPPSGHGVVSLFDGHEFTQPAADATSGQKRRAYAWGLAWAARRRILEDHGLYDAMIVGGGTRAVVSAMHGQFDKAIEAFQLNSARRDHYLRWARPYHEAIDGRVGYVPGRVYHLWHGDIENRNYAGRYRGLVDFNFDPDADLVVGANGAWHWARQNPGLQNFLLNHFVSRAEDG
jgi:hypothetical protein